MNCHVDNNNNKFRSRKLSREWAEIPQEDTADTVKATYHQKKKLVFELEFIGDPQGRVKFEGLHFTSVSINARPYD